MSVYDEYKSKIQRRAAVKHFVYKFRVPIIILLAVIVGGITAMLCMKGNITTNVSVESAQIAYGEEIKLNSAKAMLTKVTRYEYLHEGETEWTTEKPTVAGNYQVRAVANGGFGRKYGDPVSFTILPTEVDFRILSDEVTYGSNPESVEFDCKYGDKIVSDALEFTYGSYTADTTKINLVVPSLTVINSKGEDVTSSYIVKAYPHEITWRSKYLLLSLDAQDCEYNGTSVVYDKLDSASAAWIVSGDSISFGTQITNELNEVVTSAVDVGLYKVGVKRDSVHITKNGEDVTRRYDISYLDSQYRITKRPITVTTGDATREYDGEPLINALDPTVVGLVNGHTPATDYSLIASQTDVGSTDNVLQIVVFDSSGRDVTANYDVAYEYGTLTVTKCEIEVTSVTDTAVYTSERISFPIIDSYESDKLATGHELRVKEGSGAYLTYVGSTDNVIEAQIFDSVTGADKTYNYEIKYSYGTITVTPATLTVTAPSKEFYYTGKPQKLDTYDIVYNGLCYNDVISDSEVKLSELTDVSTTNNTIEFSVQNFAGKDTTDCYEIEYDLGTLKVVPRPIAVYAGDVNEVYDGERHSKTVTTEAAFVGWEIYPDPGVYYDEYFGLVDGHEARVKSTADIKYVTNVAESGKENIYGIGDYEIFDAQGNDVSKNYVITKVKPGVLSIYGRNMIAVTATREWTYDGLEHSDPSFTLLTSDAIPGLVSGHTLTLRNTTVVKNVIYEKENFCNDGDYTIEDADGNDVTDNYFCRIESGTLTVKAREVTVTTGSYGDYEYNGDAFSYPEYKVTGLLTDPKHVTEIDGNNPARQFINAGEYDNKFKLSFYDENGNDVTYNYAPVYEYGKITVKPHTISVITATAEKVYDGTPLFAEGVTCDDEIIKNMGALVERDRSQPITTLTEVNTEIVPNKFPCLVYESNGTESGNYVIVYGYGSLTVTPRPLTVETESVNSVYSDTEYVALNYTIVNGTLGTGDSDLPDMSTVTTLKEYTPEALTNELKINIVNAEGKNVNNCYEISYEPGTLKINKRYVLFTTPDDTHEYDGTDFSAVGDKSIASGIVEWHDIEAVGEPTTVKTVADSGRSNVVTYRIVNADGDVTANYDVEYIYGTLSVTPRIIIVETATESKIYDGKPLVNNTAETYHVDAIGSLLTDVKYTKGGLVSDHRLVPVTDEVSIVNAGTVKNVYSYGVVDGSGNYVTENYELIYELFDGILSFYGELTVEKRPVCVITDSATRFYDGQELSAVGVKLVFANSGDLDIVEGHEFKLTAATVVTNVNRGENNEVLPCENKINVDIIDTLDENKSSVTDNYDLKVLYGTLTVYPRSIQITTQSNSKVYDDTPLITPTDVEYRFIGMVENMPDIPMDEISVGDSYEPFVLDHTPLLLNSSIKTVTHVWESSRNLLEFDILSGGKSVLYNYEITYLYGSLTVTARPITITNESVTCVYDGTDICALNCDYTAQSGDIGLLEGQKLVATTVTKARDVLYDNSGGVISYSNYTAYKVVKNHNGEDEQDVSNDYAILQKYGSIKILPRPITVVTKSGEFEYNGNEHSLGVDFYATEAHADNTGSDCGLAEGQIIKELSREGVVNVGETENRVQFAIELPDDQTDLISNYAITYEYGTIEVTPRLIKIIVNTEEFTYNGKPQLDKGATVVHLKPTDKEYYYEENTEDPVALVGDHYLFPVGDDVTVTNVWDKAENYYYYRILTSSLPDPWKDDFTWDDDMMFNVSGNYKILQIQPGSLTVKPCPAVIRRTSLEKVYDGRYLYGNQAECDELAEGFELSPVAIPTAIKTVAESGTYVETYFIAVDSKTKSAYSDDDNYWTDNYIFSYSGSATLTILLREVTIETASAETTYSCEYLNDSSWHVAEDSKNDIAQNQTAKLVADSLTYLLNAGSTLNKLSIAVKDTDGNDVTENYDIKYNYGTLTVLPRPIKISNRYQENRSKIYDGQPLETSDEFYIAEGDVVTGHDVVLDTGRRNEFGSITDAGTTDGTIFVKVENSSKGDESSNYAITYEYGTLEVLKRTVFVKAKDIVRVYDGLLYEQSELDWEYCGKSFNDEDYQFVNGESVQITRLYVGLISGWGFKCGDYDVNIDDYSLSSGGGNYEIVTNQSTVTINKRDIVLLPENKTATYSGEAITLESTEFDSRYYDETDTAQYAKGGIIEKDKEFVKLRFEYELNGLSVLPVNKGEYRIKVSAVIDETIFTLDNYNIVSYESGTLTVTPRQITLTVDGNQKSTYSGSAVYAASVTYSVTEGSVVYGEAIDARLRFNIFADVYPGAVADPDAEFVTEAATYEVEFDTDYSSDKNDNYEIAFVGGVYTVEPYELSVITSSEEKVYSGEVIYVSEEVQLPVSAQADFLSGLNHTVCADAPFGKRDRGTYENTQNAIVMSGDNDVTYNYSIVIKERGTLVINCREFTFTFDSSVYVREYNALEFVFAQGSYEVNGLVDGHVFDKSVTGFVVYDLSSNTYSYMVDADEYTDYILGKYRITADGEDVSYNYTYSFDNKPTVVIQPKRVDFILNIADREYNGKDQPITFGECLSDADYGNNLSDVIKDFKVVTEFAEFKTAGTYDVYIRSANMIIDGVENNLNYDIAGPLGYDAQIVISKYDPSAGERQNNVSTGSAKRMYNGAELCNTNFEKNLPVDFPAGHELYVTEYPTITEPGNKESETITNKLVFGVAFNGDDVTDCFDMSGFNFSYGTLTVTPFAKLVPLNNTFTYDGAGREVRDEVIVGNVTDAETGALNVNLTFKARIASIYNGDESADSVLNAGKYTIIYTDITFCLNDTELDGVISDKLDISNEVHMRGETQLSSQYKYERTVNKRIIYVRPKNVTVPYAGQTFIEADRIAEEFDTDESHNGLLAGHYYNIDNFAGGSGGGLLSVTEGKSKYLYIASGRVLDGDDEDVSGNYDVRIAYSSDMKTLKTTSFRSKLQFGVAQIHVTPIAPEDNMLIYDGNAYDYEFDTDAIYTSEQALGLSKIRFGFIDSELCDGDYIRISKASKSASVQSAYTWFKIEICKMIDGEEVDVTKFYSVKYGTNASDYEAGATSYVTTVEATVKISGSGDDRVVTITSNDHRDGYEIHKDVHDLPNDTGTAEGYALTDKYVLVFDDYGGYSVINLLTGKPYTGYTKFFKIQDLNL